VGEVALLVNDQELIRLMKSDEPISQARKIFTSYSGQISQGLAQGESMVWVRKMEYEAVRKILRAME
jgi:hypothetical protein